MIRIMRDGDGGGVRGCIECDWCRARAAPPNPIDPRDPVAEARALRGYTVDVLGWEVIESSPWLNSAKVDLCPRCVIGAALG